VEGEFPGALISTPFLLFAALPPLVYLITLARKFMVRKHNLDPLTFFDWTSLGLFGASAAGALPTLLLFYVGFRYETEFIASLTMLALIGFCQGYLLVRNNAARKVYAGFGILLILFSVLINMALAYTGIRA
jgi:hypothetical protein